MDLSRFPRRIYTNAPTPIEHLPHFTRALAASCPGGVGPEIWIKRDDMLGLFPGGNKTRKLEFLAGDAIAPGKVEMELLQRVAVVAGDESAAVGEAHAHRVPVVDQPQRRRTVLELQRRQRRALRLDDVDGRLAPALPAQPGMRRSVGAETQQKPCGRPHHGRVDPSPQRRGTATPPNGPRRDGRRGAGLAVDGPSAPRASIPPLGKASIRRSGPSIPGDSARQASRRA